MATEQELSDFLKIVEKRPFKRSVQLDEGLHTINRKKGRMGLFRKSQLHLDEKRNPARCAIGRHTPIALLKLWLAVDLLILTEQALRSSRP